MELRDRWIHFKVCDVYIPDPEKLLIELYGNDSCREKSSTLSDSGAQQGTFAVVGWEGLEQPVIVPVERILWYFVNDPAMHAASSYRAFEFTAFPKERGARW